MDSVTIYLPFYLMSTVLFNEWYKLVTKTMKNSGAMSVLLQLISGTLALFFIPFSKIVFPTNMYTYLFLGLSIIFYTIQNRLATIARSGLDASTYSILKQISTVFMVILGFTLFKEKFMIRKFIGILLIIISNVLIFYQKNSLKMNRYLCTGIMANLSLSIALLLDVNFAQQFNLAIYISAILLIPAFLIFIVERIKGREILKEYKNSSKKYLYLTSISWTIMMITKLKSYQLGEVTVVAPLCSLAVILNVIVGYFWFNEKKAVLKKIIAGILIIISVFLIKV